MSHNPSGPGTRSRAPAAPPSLNFQLLDTDDLRTPANDVVPAEGRAYREKALRKPRTEESTFSNEINELFGSRQRSLPKIKVRSTDSACATPADEQRSLPKIKVRSTLFDDPKKRV
jgi:hypothetical protein